MSTFNGRCPAPGRFDAAVLEQHLPEFRWWWPLMQDATATGPTSATLLLALAWVQSCCQPDSIDSDGGEGLFAMGEFEARALVPELGHAMPELFHAPTAIFLACRYLNLLLKVFRLDLVAALLAFRLGLRTVVEGGAALVQRPDNVQYVCDVLDTMTWLWAHQPWPHTTSEPHAAPITLHLN